MSNRSTWKALVLLVFAYSVLSIATASAEEVDLNGGQHLQFRRHPRNRLLQTQENNSTLTALRQSLLENYDRKGYPFDEMWGDASEGTREGIPVEVGLNFHRVFDVDITNSVVDMIVWVRIKWKDPRLAWDPEIYDGQLRFWIGDGNGAGETSEIWTPDLQLWNLETSLTESLVDTFAVASSDGSIFWSRPGHVKPVCRFQGLENFPFDTLSCTMEIGSWSYSGLYIRPSKFEEGFSIGGSETAEESFAEYSLESVECNELIYPPFPGAQEEDWPVLLYHVHFQRSWEPYARGFLTLQILLNFISFCCFWLPAHVGERMGLAISSILAAVASELVVAAQLPAASELSWFAKFSFTSLMFSAVVLFESTAVIYLHYHTGNNLTPSWYKWMRKKLRGRGEEQRCDSSAPRRSTVQFNEEGIANSAKPFANSRLDDPDSNENEPDDGKVVDSTEVEDSVLNSSGGNSNENSRDSSNEAAGNTEKRQRPFPPHRSSFVDSMTSFRTRKGVKTILGRDADDFKNAKEMENNIKWQRWAQWLDEFSRVVFPVAYCVFLAIVFSQVQV